MALSFDVAKPEKIERFIAISFGKKYVPMRRSSKWRAGQQFRPVLMARLTSRRICIPVTPYRIAKNPNFYKYIPARRIFGNPSRGAVPSCGLNKVSVNVVAGKPYYITRDYPQLTINFVVYFQKKADDSYGTPF